MGSSHLGDDILILAVDEGDEGSVATQAKGTKLCQGVEGRVRIEEGNSLEGGGQARRERGSREVSRWMNRQHQIQKPGSEGAGSYTLRSHAVEPVPNSPP